MSFTLVQITDTKIATPPKNQQELVSLGNITTKKQISMSSSLGHVLACRNCISRVENFHKRGQPSLKLVFFGL